MLAFGFFYKNPIIQRIMDAMKKNWFYIFMALIAIVYIFFPNNNSTLDAYDYAASARYGIDLYHPHHLLFNAFFHAINNILHTLNFQCETLRILQLGNAIFAIGALLLTRLTLKKVTSDRCADALTLFAGCSFAMLRYSTEGETYIIPIFFSLLSSLFFLQSIGERKKTFIVFSAIVFSLACLFHQTALFGGIGIVLTLIIGKELRYALLFAIVTLCIPLAYAWIITCGLGMELTFQNLTNFMIDYYLSDSADTHIGLVNFLMTPISLFRTFFQLHGNIPVIIHKHTFLILPILLGIVSLATSFILIKRVGCFENKGMKILKSPFERAHLLIFFLSLTFAFFSHGNAEFMVMLPICLTLFIHPYINEKHIRSILLFSCGMFLWNVSTCILPNHLFDFYNEQAVVEHVRNHPEATYILTDKNLVRNQYFYLYGEEPSARMISADNKKEILKIREENNSGLAIYKDIEKPSPMSRSSLLDDNNINFEIESKESVIQGDLGTYYIGLIRLLP